MNNLTQRLTTLANKMTDTDSFTPRGRVGSIARRLGHRRVAATSVAAVALIGVSVVGGLQLAPQTSNAPRYSGSVAVVPAVSSMSPQHSPPSAAKAGPSVSVPGTRSAAPAPAVPPHIPGRLVYLRVGAEIEVVTVTAGEVHTTSFGARQLGDQVASVSPDGSKVALVHPAKDVSEYPGDLVIVRPGGARTVLKQSVSWGGGDEPVWMPDSGRLLIAVTTMDGDTSISQSYGYIDAVTGKYDELSLDPFPKYLTWSANGSYRAHADRDAIVIAGADGSVVRRVSVADQPECDHACPFAVQAISNDGRYVATARGNTDPRRVTGASIVFDTTTGARVALPGTITGIREIFFRADNSLLVQTSGKLYLVTLGGNVTATVERPDETNQADLGRYLDQ